MNLFAKATPIATTKTAATKGKQKKEIAIAGLEQLAEIDAMMKALEGKKKTLEAQVKASGFSAFMTMCHGTGKPESFIGVDGIATASVELRKRTSASQLTPDELQLLKDNGIEAFESIQVQEMFGINPKYASDSKLLEKVSAAIGKFVPADFIVMQEKQSKQVVSDETIQAVFAKRNPSEELVRTVTTMALKPKLAKTDYKAIAASIVAQLETDDDAELDAE